MACGTDPSAPVAPTGNFGGAFGDDQAYLALTLSEQDGSLVGTGWMSGGSSLGRFVISGTYTRPELEIRLAPDNDADQQPDPDTSPLELAGTLERDMIVASLSGEPDFLQDVTLARVDTTAAAVFQWSVEGAATLEQRGVASFTIPHGLELHFSPGLESDKVILGGREGRPQAGRYPIGLDTASTYQAYLLAEEPWPYGRLFQAVSGELRVDVSTPQILIGSFTFTADDVYGSGRVTVAGSYGAGCGYTRCD
jgi:hypothetical protein